MVLGRSGFADAPRRTAPQAPATSAGIDLFGQRYLAASVSELGVTMKEGNQFKPQRLFTYHLLRYTPNLVRDEWLNIGVLIFDESTGDCRLRLIEEPAEYARVARLQPAADENVLRRLRDHLEDRFESSLRSR